MGRLRHGVPITAVLLLIATCPGCGGGSPSQIQPPPPASDFSISLSPNSISIADGAAGSVNVSINPLNGFTGSVQVTLNGVPAGVVSNPSSPFAVAASGSTAVVLGAAPNAATGNFTVSAQGASGALSHSASLALTLQAAVGSALPRTTFARTDSLAASDYPFGEPRHRHIAYDPGNKHLFIANRAMNSLDVFSSVDQSRSAQISIPGVSSADLSADGTTVWVGTSLEKIFAVDTVSLRVRNRYFLSGLTPLPGTIFNRPVEVLALSNGKAMIRLRQPVSSEALLSLWDPPTNSLTDLTPAAPVLFQQGLGVLARSGDHSKVLAAANDSSGELALFDSNGSVVAGPLTLGSGLLPWVAANPDGSRFAVVFAPNGAAQLFLLDSSLHQTAAYAPASVRGVTFSRDGNYLYVSESSSGASFVTVLDGHSAQFLGRVPDASIQGVSSEIEDADETQLLFALSNRGVSFIDASKPGTLPSPAPKLASAPSLQPSDGPITGGTSVILTGQNFSSPLQLKFGNQSAANIAVGGSTQVQAASPPSILNGAVNVAAFFQNGGFALAPDAFSYGPQILEILPNAGVSAGGDSLQIYGYGFGTDPAKIAVQIGGVNAAVQKLETIPGIASSLGLDASYPFPLERITLATSAGNPGKADVLVTAPSGTAAAAKSFQFLQSLNTYSKPGYLKFLLYDQKRQRIYLTNTDHLDIFDLQLHAFLTPFQPPGGPPPNIGLRDLTMTPDGLQLIVADFGAQNIYLLDPVQGTGTTVSVGGVPGFVNSGPARVVATSAQTVFVGLSGEGGSSGACSACLAQLNLQATPPTIQPAPQPEVSALTGAPLVQGNAAGDRVFVAFGAAPGGPLAAWNAAAPNQFVTFIAGASAADLGAASDGTMFALRSNGAIEIRAGDLSLVAIPAFAELTEIPGRVSVPGVTLHPSGALIYEPFLTGAPGSAGAKGGIDILDAHSGALRLRLFLSQQFLTDVDGLHGSFLTTDENGQRLFALTSPDGSPQNAALTILQLASVPLGIGTISPSAVSAAGGATLTIRGSGFQSATAITINGKAATVTFKDVNTLSIVTPSLTPGPQQIIITNPDGETVSLDAALTAN